MRRVLLGDIMAAAVYVAGAPDGRRYARAQALIAQADAAHRYAKRFGRPHPIWGLGTLQALALGQTPSLAGQNRAAGFDLGDLRILHGLIAVLQALAARKEAAPALPCPHPAPCDNLGKSAQNKGGNHGRDKTKTRSN
jgi:hypothetical protein